jgi:exonuclease SbcC
MIPLKLQLRNFMCYRDPAPLDFSGIQLACLAGDNGHGKSALLDAMTWALWGKARARYDDELVSAGQHEMEVEFEFRLGDVHYRVIRKRELARRSRGSLDLQIKDNGRFRSFTGSTQRETQSRIDNFLRMDYDTFINSALLLQGRADEFTVKPPAERKRILAEILGLSVYDEYEQRAKDLAREKEQAEREVQARIQEIDRELEHRPEYERELEQAQAELAHLAGQAKVAEKALHELRDQMRTLEAQRAQLVDIQERIKAAEARVRDLDQQIEAQTARLSNYESILERRDDIEAGYARLMEARGQEAQYSVKLSALMELIEQRANLETVIAEAQKGLEVQQHVITDRMLESRKLADQLKSLQAECHRVAAEVQELVALQDQAQAGQQSIADLSEEASALNALNTQLKRHMANLQQNLTLLQQPTAICPLCGQDLTEDDRQRLMAQLEEEGSQQADRYRRNAEQQDDISAQIASLKSEVGRIERELRRLPALQGREATLQESVRQAQEARAKLQEQQRLLDSLQGRLERGAFAEQERGQLAKLDARIATLGYDKAAHDNVRRTLSDLSAFEVDKAELDGALQAITELRANLQQLANTRLQWVASLGTDRQRHAELSTALKGLADLSRDLSAKQQEVDELRGKEGHARQVVGAAQQKLDYCSYLARERRDRATQLRMLNEDRSIYEELRMAFGKRGVQALIIENVLPELEDEANELLRRMTDGRMSVHFETQHETKSGTTVETLDIKISDESGPRSYEMYSGGEAFRINFAIRIALSKLLARRAGAQLQTLIIDEGFGTQDAEGRQRLVEAINSIRDDFALVIVITHIEELKDAFPVRIDVYKTPAGSEIAIA